MQDNLIFKKSISVLFTIPSEQRLLLSSFFSFLFFRFRYEYHIYSALDLCLTPKLSSATVSSIHNKNITSKVFQFS